MLNNAFYRKTKESVRNSRKRFIKKDDNEKFVEQQSQLTSNAIHKSHTSYDIYTFEQNEVLMDKPIYLGVNLLELSKIIMREMRFAKLQPYSWEKFIPLHYIDTDSFALSITSNMIIKDLKNLEDLIDFSNFNSDNEIQ